MQRVESQSALSMAFWMSVAHPIKILGAGEISANNQSTDTERPQENRQKDEGAGITLYLQRFEE
jgi:hypothetical protein